MKRLCIADGCQREARRGWSMCWACFVGFLDGRVRLPAAGRNHSPAASPQDAARDWAPGELMEAWGK